MTEAEMEAPARNGGGDEDQRWIGVYHWRGRGETGKHRLIKLKALGPEASDNKGSGSLKAALCLKGVTESVQH
ncbi:hypothetical protein EYF80_032994 [Liparis tanakae]|uniref:Uncharacterized protein n=1 Tax=Liparis tanakae TaxID=230148 RepID=A0A4Z2GTH5_9TELE|nr:hypothetical protein EYF80_032994 [Liparis tanakae]